MLPRWLPRSFLIVAVACFILIHNDLVKAQDFLSNVPTPNPVYAHGTGVLSTRSEVVLIGGVGTNRAQIIENQVVHLNFAGTQAGWKRNNNRDLPNLAGVSAVPYGDQRLLVLFGVESYATNKFNERLAVSVYDPASGLYTPFPTLPAPGTPNGPDFRAGQSAALDPTTNQVFVYGGFQKNGSVSRELWSLNLTDSSWKLYPPTTNSHPVPLGTTSAVVSSNFVVCFGTTSASTPPISNCSVFNIPRSEWVPVTLNATDPRPPPRSASRITTIANNQILMFGGGDFSSAAAFDDIWTLDGAQLPQIKWTRVTTSTGRKVPSPRFDHSLAYVQNQYVLIFGGHSKPENDPTDTLLYALDTRTMAWQDNWGNFPTFGDVTNNGSGSNNNTNGTITTSESSGGGGGLSSGAVAGLGAAIAVLFALVVGFTIYNVRRRQNKFTEQPSQSQANSDQGSVTLRNSTISVSSYPSPHASYPQAAPGVLPGVQTIDPAELGSSVGSQISSSAVGAWSHVSPSYPMAMTVPAVVPVSGDAQPYNMSRTYMLMPPAVENSIGTGITQRNQSLRERESQQPMITVTDTLIVTATDRYVPSASDELSLSAGDQIFVEYVFFMLLRI
ncbi:hypothetical protein HK102_010675 [Quaeritorhiza haematococci]|nr:hypothetical protein HK102_010675 [Quaeritorhiza haematococci]